MGKLGKGDGEKGKGPRRGMAVGRGVKRETVVVLVSAAFILGFIAGALVALLSPSAIEEVRQVPAVERMENLAIPEMGLSREIRMVEERVQQDPERPDGWVRLGDLFVRSRQYGKAIEAYTKALDRQPSSADTLVKLGNAHYDREAYEEAIEAYTQALTIDPKNADVLTNLGDAYRRAKRPKEALDAFRKAAQIDPEHSASRYGEGVVLLHDLNDAAGAIKAWNEFLRVEPSGERAEKVKRMVQTLKDMSPGQ
jgi:cytochrome c-type biogenesis protein CcmH/NrfG